MNARHAGYFGLIGITLIVISLSGGCGIPSSPQGQGQIALSRKQYEEGNYILAAHQLTQFIENEPFSRELDQAYYLRGLSYYRMGPSKYAAAQADFGAALKKTRTAEVRGLCHAAIGHIYFERRDESPEQAIEHYQAALKDLAEAPPRDVVLYQLGICLQRMGRWEEADLHLSECFNRFSGSEYAAAARRIFGAREFRFQMGAFAELSQARRKIASLKEHGLQGDWAMRQENGRPVYPVYTGHYDNYDAAREASADLLKIEPEAVIIATPLPGLSQEQGNNHENKP